MMAFLLVLTLAVNQAEAKKDMMDQAKDVGKQVSKALNDAKDTVQSE